MDLNVRGGLILDVGSASRSSAGFRFTPAQVKLTGTSFSPECPLADYARDPGRDLSDEVRNLVGRKLDAIWVRARIMALFHVDSLPESERIEKSLMTFGFAVVSTGSEGAGVVAFPFECTDYYGRSHLFFSESELDAATRRAIGSAFWELLLSVQEEVAEYEDRAYHLGAGVWMHYGRRHGAFFYEERDDGSEE